MLQIYKFIVDKKTKGRSFILFFCLMLATTVSLAQNGAKITIKKNSISVIEALKEVIIRKSKFPQNPKRSVRFSGKRTKRSVQKRKARNTQKAETKVL